MTTLGFFLLFCDAVVAGLVGIVFLLTRGIGGGYFGSFSEALRPARIPLLVLVLVNLFHLCLLLTVSATT